MRIKENKEIQNVFKMSNLAKKYLTGDVWGKICTKKTKIDCKNS